MAGAGFKTFNTGDVLLASEVNTYLMQQTVMVFDDATARTSALGANVAEGMFSYLKDTNLTYRYDGSAWLSDAGTTSPLTTKGDLWTYSTTDARLPVGTDGHTLVADSSTATGLKWAAASTTPTFVGVHLTNSADQTVSNATNKILDWDTETIDTDGFHSTTVNNSRITIPSGKAGKYLLVALVQFDPNATGTRYLELNKNGSIVTGGAYGYTYNLNNGGYGTAFMSRIVDAAVNDYFQVYAWQNSGGNLLVQCDQYQSYFGMYLIGV